MKYDTIIIGGGLSGLVAGVKLASANRKVAIITSGQSALHFSSGSFSLLSKVEGEKVSDPIEALAKLPEAHPYRKIGSENVRNLASDVPHLFAKAGVLLNGNASECHYRLTPLGLWEPTWLTIDTLAACTDPRNCPWRNAVIVNFKGYLDFYPEYLADGLNKMGFTTRCEEVTLPELTRLRKSTSEMRAASIAKVLRGNTLESLAAELLRVSGDADVIFMPAVIGLKSNAETDRLSQLVDKAIRYVPVIPMSVVGVRAESMLRRLFESLGGTYLLGDSVKSGDFKGNLLQSVRTVNLGENTPLEADQFILATGSFFSQGLVAKPDAIVEPVFGLDVECTATRPERYNKDFFGPQAYMRFGVKTDSDFRVSLGGKTIENLRAIGAILAGADALKEGSGAGIATITALHAAQRILS